MFPPVRFVPIAFLAIAATALSADKVNFEDHIKPIFRAKCLSCHNTNKKTADLDLSNYTAMMQGGGSGESIDPGSPDNSYLFMLITHDSEPYMPPNSDRLPDEMIDTVRKWIEAGAPETASSRVMLPKKPAVDLSVDVSAGARPDGPPPLPDVLNLEPVVHTSSTTTVSAIATSPWAKLVAVAGQKQVILYNSETLQPLGVLPFPEGQARVLKFSRSGGLLLAGGGHGAAKGLAVVWDIRTGERIIEVGDELDEVLAADISADQSLVALGGPGKIVRVYNTTTGELAYEIIKHTDWIYSLEFSPDSVLLATADRTGGLHVWESFTGRQYLTLNGHKGGVTSVSWRIDSNVLASASEDRSVKLWEMENGKNIKSWNADGSGTLSMEFCRDGRLVTGGRDRTTKIWDQNGKQLRAFEAFSDLAVQVSHCDETNRVIAGDWSGEIRVWKADDGARVGNLTTNPPLLEVRLNETKKQAESIQQKLAAQQESFNAAQETHAKQVAAVGAAKQTLEMASKAVQDHQAALKPLEAQLADARMKEKTLQQTLETLRKAIPELAAASTKAQEASGLVKEDVQLKEAAARLADQVAQQSANVEKLAETLKTVSAAAAKSANDVQGMQSQLKKAEAQVAAAKAMLEKQTAALKPLDEKLAAAKAAVESVQAEATRATAAVERWQHYIALRDELSMLNAKREARDEVQLASLEADAALKAMQQQLDEAAASVAAQDAAIQSEKARMATLQKSLADSARKKTETAAAIATQESVLPVLQAAVEKAQAASGILPEDKQILESVAALKKAAASRTAMRDQLAKQMTDLAAAMADAKKQRSAAEQVIAKAQAERAATEETMNRMKGEIQPVQQKADEARATLAKAEAEVSRVEAIVEARREQIRPQLQLTQVQD